MKRIYIYIKENEMDKHKTEVEAEEIGTQARKMELMKSVFL